MSKKSEAYALLAAGYKMLSTIHKEEEEMSNMQEVTLEENVLEEATSSDASKFVEEETAVDQEGSDVTEEGEESSEVSEKEKEKSADGEEEWEPINVWKLKQKMAKEKAPNNEDIAEGKALSSTDKREEAPNGIAEKKVSNNGGQDLKETTFHMADYKPLLARRTKDGQFFAVLYKGEVFILPQTGYTKMLKSTNQDERKVELKVKGCYKCHNPCHEKGECKTFPIPTCTSCGRLGVDKNECPTYTCMFLKRFGFYPAKGV